MWKANPVNRWKAEKQADDDVVKYVYEEMKRRDIKCLQIMKY